MDEVRITQSRTKVLLLLAGSLAFVAGYVLLPDPDHQMPVWGGWFFGLCALVAAVLVVRPRTLTARPGRVLDFRRPHPNRQDGAVEGRDRLLPVKNPRRLQHGRIELQRRCRQQAARNMGCKAPLGRRRRHKRRLVLFDRRPGQPTQRLSRPRARRGSPQWREGRHRRRLGSFRGGKLPLTAARRLNSDTKARCGRFYVVPVSSYLHQ